MDPCQFAKCPAHPNAKCVSDFCGGCNARFFEDGEEVTDTCGKLDKKTHLHSIAANLFSQIVQSRVRCLISVGQPALPTVPLPIPSVPNSVYLAVSVLGALSSTNSQTNVSVQINVLCLVQVRDYSFLLRDHYLANIL